MNEFGLRMSDHTNEVAVKWVGADIQEICYGWSPEKCEEVLGAISDELKDRVIEVGNDILYYLVTNWIEENEGQNDE
jgi:hypothetical protein